MVLRVSVPGKPTRLIDLGPAHAERLSKIARLPIDEAIVYAAAHGHTLRVSR